MAKKSFLGKESRKLTDVINNTYTVSDETKNAILGINTETTASEAIGVVDLIEKDQLLPRTVKNELIENIKIQFIDRFNFDNCPEDYEELKKEAKFLAGMTQYSFLLMAQRLQSIKLFELYKKDGYLDFSQFVENEMPVNKSTAYNYINLLECFGFQALGKEENLEYSKLIPMIPVFKKAPITELEREQLKHDVLKKAKSESFREMTADAKELKIKYGIEKKKDFDEERINKIKGFTEFLKKTNKSNNGEKAFLKMLRSELNVYFEKWGDYEE